MTPQNKRSSTHTTPANIIEDVRARLPQHVLKHTTPANIAEDLYDAGTREHHSGLTGASATGFLLFPDYGEHGEELAYLSHAVRERGRYLVMPSRVRTPITRQTRARITQLSLTLLSDNEASRLKAAVESFARTKRVTELLDSIPKIAAVLSKANAEISFANPTKARLKQTRGDWLATMHKLVAAREAAESRETDLIEAGAALKAARRAEMHSGRAKRLQTRFEKLKRELQVEEAAPELVRALLGREERIELNQLFQRHLQEKGYSPREAHAIRLTLASEIEPLFVWYLYAHAKTQAAAQRRSSKPLGTR